MPVQSVGDVWWAKWHWDSFSHIGIIAGASKTNGRSLGTFLNAVVSEIEERVIERDFYCLYRVNVSCCSRLLFSRTCLTVNDVLCTNYSAVFCVLQH